MAEGLLGLFLSFYGRQATQFTPGGARLGLLAGIAPGTLMENGGHLSGVLRRCGGGGKFGFVVRASPQLSWHGSSQKS